MRTVEQFVAEMLLRGRSREQTRSVALCTRWAGDTEQVLAEYDKQTKFITEVEEERDVA